MTVWVNKYNLTFLNFNIYCESICEIPFILNKYKIKCTTNKWHFKERMMTNKLFVYLHPYIYFMIMQRLELKLQKSLQWVGL